MLCFNPICLNPFYKEKKKQLWLEVGAGSLSWGAQWAPWGWSGSQHVAGKPWSPSILFCFWQSQQQFYFHLSCCVFLIFQGLAVSCVPTIFKDRNQSYLLCDNISKLGHKSRQRGGIRGRCWFRKLSTGGGKWSCEHLAKIGFLFSTLSIPLKSPGTFQVL